MCLSAVCCRCCCGNRATILRAPLRDGLLRLGVVLFLVYAADLWLGYNYVSRGENVLVGGIEQLVHTGERLVHEEYPDAEWPLSPQETDDLVREAFKPVWYSLFTFEGFHVVVACFIISSAIFRTCLVFLTTRILLEFVIVVRFLALTLVLVPGTVLMMMLGPEADVAAVATFGFVLVNCLLLAAECLALDGTFSLQRVVRSGGDGTERMCPREIRNAQEARLLEPLVSRV